MSTTTALDLESDLRSGGVRPVYVLVGEERYLADQAVRALRNACLTSAETAFNEEHFIAGEVDANRVIAASRTTPMMAKRRFVLVRSVDRWEGRSSARGEQSSNTEDERDTGGTRSADLDRIADYALQPTPSTCLVLMARKLDARRRLLTAAKKGGFLVTCDRLSDDALARWVAKEARARGHSLEPSLAHVITQLAGPELGYVADALERLTLFVGPGQPIHEDAVAEIIVPIRETSVFQLVEAVGRRDVGRALSLLAEVFDPRAGGLPLIGLLAWSVRQLLRFEAALRSGARPEEAAKTAGAPPFKAKELQAQLRGLSARELERWLVLLAQADLALKGSRRPPQAILETLVLAMATP